MFSLPNPVLPEPVAVLAIIPFTEVVASLVFQVAISLVDLFDLVFNLLSVSTFN